MKRPTRKAAGIALGIAALATAGILVSIQPKAVEVCVTYYEDANQGGDHNAACAVGATNVHVANLGLITAGLHNGCNRGINQSSTWADCISSANVALLPASTKLIFYRDTNYGFTQTCFDADGSHNLDLTATGDTISSFRIIGGNCP